MNHFWSVRWVFSVLVERQFVPFASVSPAFPVHWCSLCPRAGDSGGSLLFQVTNKQRREQQRLEKKKRQEERHRHKALESRSSHRDNNRSEADASTQVTLVKTFAALNIWLWPPGSCEKGMENGGPCARLSSEAILLQNETQPTESHTELVFFKLPPFLFSFVSDVSYLMKVQWSHSCSVIKISTFRGG